MRTLTGVALAAAVMGAGPVFGQESPAKWGGFLDLEGKLGSERALGEADLFVPIAQDERNLLFANVKARLDDNDSKEGNFGAGWRHMHASGWNGGVYGYFDRRLTEHDHLFNQLTFGAEALGEDFDLRVNSYWPIGQRVKLVDGLNTAELSGTSVIFRGGEERALQGFDAEVGWRAPVFPAGGPIDLRLYAGAYTFDDDTVEDVTGPRLRAELTGYDVPGLAEGARLTLGAEWQHDDARGTQGFASLRLRIPLQPEKEGSRKLTAQERRMSAPVVRDVDIVAQAGTFGAPETATRLANGNTFTVFNSASTAGTDLDTAVAAAGANSTVILSGTFNTGADTVSMANGQTLTAGPVTVRSASGRPATLTTSATIAGTNSGRTVQINSTGTLSGLTVSNAFSGGTGGRAVDIADGSGNVMVIDNTISVTQSGANAATALGIGQNTTSTVRGNVLTVTGSGAATTMTALGMSNTNTTATVSGNTMSASGGGTNNMVLLGAGTTLNSGSTGNIRGGGACNGTPASGAIGFTDGTTCPP